MHDGIYGQFKRKLLSVGPDVRAWPDVKASGTNIRPNLHSNNKHDDDNLGIN